ncbi:MAG: hypothetical protein K6F09_03860 [Clostridiales bacterium]|nr:hypothetical protein [Clostridiales bacterium]
MKKILIPLLAAALIAAVFAGCDKAVRERNDTSSTEYGEYRNETNDTEYTQTEPTTRENVFTEISSDISEALSNADMFEPENGRVSDTSVPSETNSPD